MDRNILSDALMLTGAALAGRKGQKQHDYLYFEFQELGGRQAVRSDNPYYELYNLDEDPGEEHDLLAEKPDITEHLMALMQEAHVPNPDFPILPGE